MTVSPGDAHPFPINAGRFRVVFPILNNTGALVTAAAGLDSERSIDQATFADCTNEAVEIATGSGIYYLDLTSAEMTSKCTAVIVKTTTTDAKTTTLVLYPHQLPALRTGTAQAGAATTITLDAGASAKDNAYLGAFVQCTNNTPTNVLGQTRRITSYVGSTKVATVGSAWGTNPSNATTFAILIPQTVNVTAWGGQPLGAWNTAGVPVVDATHAAGTAWNSGAIGAATLASDTIAAAKIAAGAITNAKFAAGAIDATAIATDAITAAKIATDAITAAKVADGTIDAATFAAGAINAAAIAADALTAAKIASDVGDEFAAALLDLAAGVETGRTVRQAMRIILAALAGKASGLDTTTAVFRDTNDLKDRITATVDANGNRSAVTLDGS